MRVFLHTFGCKANQYDTERVREAVERAGARVVPDAAQADAAVINSCTVTHVAESKMRGLVRRIARRRPGVRTVVMGCAAALDDGAIARLPGVAAVVGGADVDAVLSSLALPPAPRSGGLTRCAHEGRGWLRIQDGCDEHCTFCATTLARGANRSRAAGDIVSEARSMAASHAELVLTGIHIGSYGADRGSDLSRLVEQLVTRVPEVRFRLSSLEATEVDDRLADLMVSAPHRLAPHLHAPLQSGSDPVLKRMGRHWYTGAAYRARVERLAERLPVFGLGADVMVGFPGETPADHAATAALVEALPFTYLHVFPYSERPGAASRRLGPAVPPAVVERRAAQLREMGRRKAGAHRAARHGQQADVVLSGRARGVYQGVTEDYLDVMLDAEGPVGPRLRATLQVTRRGLVATGYGGTAAWRHSGMTP